MSTSFKMLKIPTYKEREIWEGLPLELLNVHGIFFFSLTAWKILSPNTDFFFLCKSDIYFAYTGQMSRSKAFSRNVSSWSNDFHSEIRGLKETEGAKATYPFYESCPQKCVCVFHGWEKQLWVWQRLSSHGERMWIININLLPECHTSPLKKTRLWRFFLVFNLFSCFVS